MPFPDTPCATCPRLAAGVDGRCWSQRSRVTFACDSIARGETTHLPLIAETSITAIPEPPGIVERAANFAASAIAHASAGFPASSPEPAAERMAICQTCKPFFDPSNQTCRQCGCHLNTKTAWLEQACPIGKW